MQNQINTQYLPQGNYNQCQMMPQTPVCQAPNCYPMGPSVGAVNIQIYNPTANPQGMYQPYPYNYNNMFQQQQMMPSIQPTQYENGNINPSMNQTMNLNNNQNGIAAQGDGADAKKTEDKKENKPKVALTDDYIKTLENYLNSQDKKIRLMGAKELFDRFKEDETRKDDAALTALLNKTLQDPAETVKFVALTALDAGYATGNDETAQILTQMQSSNSSYGEDAALASQILLKMSGYKANADAAALNQGANLNQNQGLSNNQTANQAQTVMPTPSLQATNNQANALDTKLPPTDTDTLLKQNGATMNQNMQINNDGTTNMNQQMVPPMNSQAVV